MTEKQLIIENGNLFYRIEQKEAIVTGYRGFAANLTLPPQIEDMPVVRVDRKAFLSQKTLCGIHLPDTIKEVGDWAFAHCDSLAEISFPKREVRFGRAVFKDCGSLQRISVREPDLKTPTELHDMAVRERASGAEAWEKALCAELHDRDTGEPMPGAGGNPPCAERHESDAGEPMPGASDNPPCPELLAAAVTLLDAPYLLDIPGAGSAAWLEQWDIRLLSILRAADAEGYISQSVYGEEDYIGTDLEEFTSAKRENKVRLSFLRLLHLQRLSPSLREELEQYLRSLTKGQPTEETWEIIRREHSSHREYYSLFVNLGCMTDENFQGILADIGEDSPEMKAFFLKHREERRQEAVDFFESLEL